MAPAETPFAPIVVFQKHASRPMTAAGPRIGLSMARSAAHAFSVLKAKTVVLAAPVLKALDALNAWEAIRGPIVTSASPTGPALTVMNAPISGGVMIV